MTDSHHHNEPEAEFKSPTVRPASIFGGDRRHLALWLAVGGTTAVIVVMWFLLLPMQLGDVRLPNAKDLSRWSVKTEVAPEVRSFDENLRLIRERLTELTQQSATAPVSEPQTVNIDIEELRFKLEAASIKNETIKANEAKK